LMKVFCFYKIVEIFYKQSGAIVIIDEKGLPHGSPFLQ
jgi:hypothetical protein